MYLARKDSGHIYVLDVRVYVPSQENQRSYICVLGESILSLFTIFLSDFWNCSDSIFFFVPVIFQECQNSDVSLTCKTMKLLDYWRVLDQILLDYWWVLDKTMTNMETRNILQTLHSLVIVMPVYTLPRVIYVVVVKTITITDNYI